LTLATTTEKPSTIVLDFDDNKLLPPLTGEHDAHLARIEQKLGVTLTPRGNQVAIVGTVHQVRTARSVLEDLYERLKTGLEVRMGDVDGAVRMAEAATYEDDDAEDGDHKPKIKAKRKSAGTADHSTQVKTQKRIITPRSPTQAEYVHALFNHELVFGLGPAGTGKTYLAVAVAVSMLLDGVVDRLILTRPAVEAGERLGFLPGTLDEKIDPYMRPMYDALYDFMPGEKVHHRRDVGDIEVAPLAYMRGRTLTNAFIILDEAQNTTTVQMKMFLTRMGENSRMAVTGDVSQVDLPMGQKSGLKDALEILPNLKGVAAIQFSHVDVVRHPMVTRVVRAYEDRDLSLITRSGDRG
jgi:phosphate starvation-inducible protein PhoH and related proteins